MGHRHVIAVTLVRSGLSYGDAADVIGITRNAVAGACHRAGVKAPMTPEKFDRMRTKISAKKWRWWRERSAAERSRQGAMMAAGRQR